MGAADVVPGVSGGTLALILGHYDRLISAISKIDSSFFRLLLRGQWQAAAQHIDGRFLAGLGAGIASGILALASLMHYLLEFQQPYVYAVFVGLILGSSVLVARRLTIWRTIDFVMLCTGVTLAAGICILQPMHSTLNVWSAFFAATIAICAMILPGISGAFVLFLLGFYHPITSLIKGLPHGDFTFAGLTIIASFCLGCLCGLLAFSRLLRWLLTCHHNSTLAFLVGLMFGSLVKLWPFQQPTPETAELEFKFRIYEFRSPFTSDANLTLIVGLALVSFATTIILEQIGHRLTQQSTR